MRSATRVLNMPAGGPHQFQLVFYEESSDSGDERNSGDEKYTLSTF